MSKIPYSLFETFCLRTPIFPVKTYLSIVSGNIVDDSYFLQFLNNPIFNEAIYLASSELHKALEKTKKAKKFKSERLKQTLLKYLARSCTRSTPFGLFAGYDIGKFDDKDQITISKVTDHSRKTRLDMEFWISLLRYLEQDFNVRKELSYTVNSSLYKIGAHYRYVEHYYEKGMRFHKLAGIDAFEEIDRILKFAKNNRRFNELSAFLTNENITNDEAEEFIHQLIDNQILQSHLHPSMTGDPIHQQFFEKLEYLSIKETCTWLQNTHINIGTIDEKIGNTIDSYLNIIKKIKKNQDNIRANYLFQTDLSITTLNNTLSKKWAFKLLKGIEVLSKLTYPNKKSSIEDFKKAFIRKYETKQVPLLEALDVEIGIGYLQYQRATYPSEFLEDIVFKTKHEGVTLEWDKATVFLNKKVQTAQRNKKAVIVLSTKELNDFKTNLDKLPDTFSAITELLHINGKRQLFLDGVGNKTATKLLGRFAEANKDMHKFLNVIINKEAILHPNKILAEIVHLPEDRTGNIIKRPTSLRAYEIPYLGKASVDTKYQISIQDLILSVEKGVLKLKSRKHNKEVIPYLSNALPVYQFLCEFTSQNKITNLRAPLKTQ